MSCSQLPDESEEWVTTQELTRTREISHLSPDDPALLITNRLRALLISVKSGKVVPDALFHRLCGRVVLAVLMTKDGQFYEGINTEMSIVTGSICAERAAIVHARSRRPNLGLTELAAVACVTIPIESENLDRNPLWPCGVCMEWVLKIQSRNPDFRLFAFDSVLMMRVVERRTASLGALGATATRLSLPFGLNRPVRQNLRQSYRKILELIANEGSMPTRSVRKSLPWVRKWWLSDLLEKGYIEEIDGAYSVTEEGERQLETLASQPPSPFNNF